MKARPVWCNASVLLVVVVAMLAQPVRAGGGDGQARAAVRPFDTTVRLPLAFEANVGQASREVDFVAHGPGYAVLLGPDEVQFSLLASTLSPENAVLRMRLVDANAQAKPEPGEQLSGKAHYLVGSDSSKWRRNVPTYARVGFRNVYPGVDVAYYGNDRRLEHDFVISPGADPRPIILAFEGADVEVSAAGDLLLKSGWDTVVALRKPLAYQEIDGRRAIVASGYKVGSDSRVRFEIGAYDTSQPLIIDPVFVYSTHLGGTKGDAGHGVALDRDGNVYVTGDTTSTNFPRQAPRQRRSAGSTDVFIAKLTPDGSRLVYSTYLGGQDSDVGYALALDATGNVFITGDTRSTDFPLVNAVQAKHGGSADIFVAKLSADGSQLVYSTFVGGSAGERGQGIGVDTSGAAAVTGYTQSTNFPTQRPLQAAFAGGNADAFVFKLDPTGGAFVYSTYLGGGNDRPDLGEGIAVDAHGNAYVTGFTNAIDFPTVGPIQPFRGPTDVFVTKINPTGTALIYSTHLGGTADDEGMAIAIDTAGSAYITGHTESLNFPTTEGAYSRGCVEVKSDIPIGNICSGGDAFVMKLSPDGSKLMYSTYINGSRYEAGRGIAVDGEGRAYVTGFTGSPDFATVNPLQKQYGGGTFDAFVLQLNATGSAVTFATYLGASGNDGGYGIAADARGSVVVTGFAEGDGFPTHKPIRGAAGASDVFVAKLEAPAQTAELQARVVAAGIPDAGAITVVGEFHRGGPIRDKAEFRALTDRGAVLDASRILVASSSNFGAPLGREGYPSGAVLSIDPSAGDTIIVPPAFAADDGQASAGSGRVILFAANSPAFLNRVHNSGAVTADLPPVAAPTGISINNAFGRVWFTSMPSGRAGAGLHAICDADGRPLKGAPSKTAGGVFTGAITNRAPQVMEGSVTSGAVATALLGRSPDGGGRAVFAGLNADGSLVQLHVEKGIDGLAPVGTVSALGAAPRAGMVFNWVPDPMLYVTDATLNAIIVLSLRTDGEVFRVEKSRRFSLPELNAPIDIAPALMEIASPAFSSNTTLAGAADMYVANRGDGTVARMRQDGTIVAVRRIALPGIGAIGPGQLNGIAVSADARAIWLTVTGKMAGLPDGAVLEIRAFGAAGSPSG